eukprot:1592976-Alexandrium_andersonii.AAC.1
MAMQPIRDLLAATRSAKADLEGRKKRKAAAAEAAASKAKKQRALVPLMDHASTHGAEMRTGQQFDLAYEFPQIATQ